jgi:membrane protein YqaA with SNARE-associated domain
MQALLHWLFTLFLSPWGLLILAALDSSAIFYVPFATDVVLIILAARNPPRFWLYPVIATLGSLVGASITYAMGKKLRESGLEHLISRRRLENAKTKNERERSVGSGDSRADATPFSFHRGAAHLRRNED